MKMKKMMLQRAGLAGVALLWALALGCGDDNPTSPPLTDSTAEAAGSAIAAQAVELTKEFTTASFGLPIDAIVAPSMHLRLSKLQDLRTTGEDCAVYGDSTDTDGDGVPDDYIVTFPADSCMATADSITLQLSGSIRVTDPGTAAGFNITYSNVRLRASHVNGDFLQVDFNGTHGVNATTTSATLNENVTMTIAAREGTVNHSASIGQNWNANFTCATGAMFDVDGVLPDGTLSLSGSSNWTADGQFFAFTVQTPTPLVHDADCTLDPDIIAGQLRALASGQQGGAFIRVQFVGCGVEPIVTLVGQPSS